MSDDLKKKIAVGGIEHETAGFLKGETPLIIMRLYVYSLFRNIISPN